MTTANESKLGGARGGHRGPIVLRVAAARVLPLLPVAARGARLVLSMGLAAGCVRARSSSSPLRGGHCPPLAASTSRLEVWLRCSVHVGCGTPLFRRVVGCRRPARVREGHAEARRRVAGSALHRAWRGRRGEAEAAGGCTRCCLIRCGGGSSARGARVCVCVCVCSVVHCGAVVADAPSPLSTPRSAAGQAQLRLGQPLCIALGQAPTLSGTQEE